MPFARIAAPWFPTLVAAVLALLVVCLTGPDTARAGQVNLAVLLANSGFEDGLEDEDGLDEHTHWVATIKNDNYLLEAPVVNPLIVPKGETDPLEAPAGDHFVGVLNPFDSDVNGRLVHDAVAGVFPSNTEFTVTVFANRGRLAAAPKALFESTPSEVTLQFFGWTAGSVPVVDPSNDNWSRTPAKIINQSFTNWGPNGEWRSQKFKFVPNKEFRFVSLSLTVKNHQSASYAAFDVVR